MHDHQHAQYEGGGSSYVTTERDMYAYWKPVMLIRFSLTELARSNYRESRSVETHDAPNWAMQTMDEICANCLVNSSENFAKNTGKEERIVCVKLTLPVS